MAETQINSKIVLLKEERKEPKTDQKVALKRDETKNLKEKILNYENRLKYFEESLLNTKNKLVSAEKQCKSTVSELEKTKGKLKKAKEDTKKEKIDHNDTKSRLQAVLRELAEMEEEKAKNKKEEKKLKKSVNSQLVEIVFGCETRLSSVKSVFGVARKIEENPNYLAKSPVSLVYLALSLSRAHEYQTELAVQSSLPVFRLTEKQSLLCSAVTAFCGRQSRTALSVAGFVCLLLLGEAETSFKSFTELVGILPRIPFVMLSQFNLLRLLICLVNNQEQFFKIVDAVLKLYFNGVLRLNSLRGSDILARFFILGLDSTCYSKDKLCIGLNLFEWSKEEKEMIGSYLEKLEVNSKVMQLNVNKFLL